MQPKVSFQRPTNAVPTTVGCYQRPTNAYQRPKKAFQRYTNAMFQRPTNALPTPYQRGVLPSPPDPLCAGAHARCASARSGRPLGAGLERSPAWKGKRWSPTNNPKFELTPKGKRNDEICESDESEEWHGIYFKFPLGIEHSKKRWPRKLNYHQTNV